MEEPLTIGMVGRVNHRGQAVHGVEFDGVVAKSEDAGTKAGQLRRWTDLADLRPGDVNVFAGKDAKGVQSELIGDNLARPVAQLEGDEKKEEDGVEDVVPQGAATEACGNSTGQINRDAGKD